MISLQVYQSIVTKEFLLNMKDIVNKTRPGINDKAMTEKLSPEDLRIVDLLSRKYWYVTRIEQHTYGTNSCHVVFMKPVEYVTQNFNIRRELILIMSPYSTFEPRTLDVLDTLDVQQLRLEEICCIIVSHDPNIENVIRQYQKSNKESRVFVPFFYEELQIDENDEFVINRMRTYFYARDLFGIQDALKKELYFFGRGELIQELVNKHDNLENAGIFGLRKTGKTSILYGVQRTLNKKGSISSFIDCQVLHLMPWNLALRTIIQKLVEENGLKQKLIAQNNEKYNNEAEVYPAFENDMRNVLSAAKKNILLIFDEIENITPDTSATASWNKGESFLKFWQVIRSFFQSQYGKYRYTYLIAGTNPRCIEMPKVNNVDNPLFSQFMPSYIQPFDYSKTAEMLDQLGGYMGIRFSPEVITHIEEDFGGHPLLIRQVCSYIHRNTTLNRPVVINKAEYLEYKKNFYQDQAGFSVYAKMILQVLMDWYPDEYQMLQWLALGDISSFKEFSQDNEFINHLRNYGIIGRDSTKNEYHFRIEALKNFLLDINKYKHPALSEEDKIKEICSRRVVIEKKLRRLVKRQLKSTLGETMAKEEIIRALYGPHEIGHKSNNPYAEFFDPNKHDIYLDTLFKIIERQYGLFENLFGLPKHEFDPKASILNQLRRIDAHSKKVEDSDFQTFRGIASWFEGVLADE